MHTHAESIDLEDPVQSGVYLVAAEDLDAVEAADHAPDTCVRRVRLGGRTDRDDVVAAIDEALDVQAARESDWDALGERLVDLSWLPAQGYVLLLDGARELREARPQDFEMMLDALDEAAATWANARIPFFAFVELPGDTDTAAEEVEVFELNGEYVELNHLLKLVGICDSGGAGKALVATGAVTVDGHTELRKACKIRAGQRVQAGGRCILVAAPQT